MLKDIWQEAGRLENIFLEIIEDPTKKEILLYPICYCQLVRKDSNFEIELTKLISCASKTFHTFKGRWQDILLELDLFQLITPKGDVLYGKEFLKIQSPEGFKISFLPEYREVFYEVYSKLLKYWTVLSKISSYSRRSIPAEQVYLSALIFNEELFPEAVHFVSMQSLRFPEERSFFYALKNMSEFYIRVNEKRELKTSLLEKSLSLLEELRDPYYGISVERLKRDIETLLRDIERGKRYFVLKIPFLLSSGNKKGFFKEIFEKVFNKLAEIRRKKLNLILADNTNLRKVQAFPYKRECLLQRK